MSYEGMTIYFMRHGETYLNLYERMQGWSNAPLTEKGILDVRRSGYGIRDVEFDAVYTSDLYRTIETAQLVLKENHHAAGLQIEPLKEFREVFFGVFEGLEVPRVYERVSEVAGFDSIQDFMLETTVYERMDYFKKADPHQHAESFMELWRRVEQGLLNVINHHKYDGDTILLVAHGMVIRIMMQTLIADFDIPDHLANASITKVTYKEGQFHLEAYNQTSHFADPELLDEPSDS